MAVTRSESTHDRVFAVVAGEEVAEVLYIEVQDSVSLAQRYLDDLPASRYIPGE